MKHMKMNERDECEEIYIKSERKNCKWKDLSSLNMSFWIKNNLWFIFVIMKTYGFITYS